MRRVIILSFLAVLVLALAPPARASDAGEHKGTHVVLNGGLDVARGEHTGTIVVFNGAVRIDGDVRGSAVVFNGALTVSGTVRDNVFSLNGKVVLQPSARVGGDLVTRQKPTIEPGATVDGTVKRLRNLSISFGLAARLAFWVAYTVSTLLLGFLLLGLAPRAMEGAAVTARNRVGASIGWGAALFFGLPLLGILLAVTVVGLPLGLSLLLALWFIYTIGYTTSLLVVGRAMVRPPRGRVVAFLAGWAALRILALIPFVGGLLWFAGAVFGLGALAAAASGARRAPAGVPPPPPVPAPTT